ncbi:MAG: hypothetical protein NHB14_20680 [Desulfosporosinus sp.]|nr:hypothetical protein [Desulfosporosinus sp.]
MTFDSTVPVMDGTASAGAVWSAARRDHRHPTDTTRAPLSSPDFTGTPTVPTATVATNSTQIASTAFVKAVVAALVDSSPGTLDTLNELAAALGDDPNFAATVTAQIGGKIGNSTLGSVDFNTVTVSGAYRLSGGNTNSPAGVDYGQLFVIHGGGDSIAQFVTGYNSNRYYLRHGNPPNVGGSGVWTNWVELVVLGADGKIPSTQLSSQSISGTYTGDNAVSRFIPLGFTPSAVLVITKTGMTSTGSGTGYVVYGGLALTGSPASRYAGEVAVDIATNGFNVHLLANVQSNNVNYAYHYIAFK